jgi:putative flippase GtrA
VTVHLPVPKGIARLFERYTSFRFIIIGALNTGFSYSVFALLLFLGFGIEIGSLLALLVGILFSYLTQSSIVFRYTSAGAFARFILMWGVIYAVNLMIIRAVMVFGTSTYLAAAIATGPVTVISYFLQKLAVFRRPATRDIGGQTPP